MAIILPSGFVITNNEPVDSRLSVADSASRFSLSVSNVYEGITVYERDTNIIYVLTDATAPSSASSWVALISNTSSSIATSASYSVTSSYALSGNGSFTGSFTGSFIGDGAGLTNIPASGITGLNLSQIASGSATASISPVSGFRVNTNSVFTGSTTNELVRITQTGPGLAFVVEDSTNPDSTRFAIDTSGSVSIGTFIPLSGSNLYDNVKLQSTITGKIYSVGVAGTSDGTGINGQSVGVLGRAIGNLGYNFGGQFSAENGQGYNFGIISYANGDGSNTIESVGGEFLATSGLGTLGIRAQATGDGIYTLQSIGGVFDANNSISNYSIQLTDGTEGVNKVLVSQTADGKANWSNDLNITTVTASFSGDLTGTASYAETALSAPAYLPLTGGTISGNLTVIGTASFVYTTSSIVNVGNSTVLVNTNYPAVRFGGISVVDSGSFGNSSTGSLLWDSLMNRWIYSNPSGSTYDGGILIAGPKNTSGLGNETGMTEHFVAVGQGTDHIQPGTIFNSGSITQVTGSLTVTAGVTGSFTGSYVGSGDGLYNIPASGITGLNLSQISSGSVSASISPNLGLQINTNVTATSFTGSFSGSFTGTGSYSTQALSSSYAASASVATTASYYAETDPVFVSVSGSLVTTASFNAFTSSYNTGSFTGSFYGNGAGLTGIFPVTTNAQILISTGSVLAARSVTGDIAITNAGVTTIQTGAVTFSKIQTLSQAALIGATGSAGGVVQEIPIIEAYVPTGSAFTTLLETTTNWDINGVYIGSAITGTYQGQSHLNNDYWFTAVADNNWIRLIRG